MIQWYPGHMAKAKRILRADLKLVDLVIEILDARIPGSSQNPALDELLHTKERIIVLNKKDLAADDLTCFWLRHFQQKHPSIAVNALKGEGISSLLALIRQTGAQINSRVLKKGRKSRDIRIMIIGIPNVGKSALINVLTGSSMAKTGNKPGVTRGRQWIGVGDEIQLLDTPGILWPKFGDEDVGYKLALTGAISDDIFDQELAAYKLIEYLLNIDSDILSRTYQIKLVSNQPDDILVLIGKKRGCLCSGGRIDRDRASKTLINEFRKGKLGPVTLEKPVMEA